MSTFKGKIAEIPDISVDKFDNENVNSSIYFLSHCHYDHMCGLEDWAFQHSFLQRPDVYLYASPISVLILKGLFPAIETKLKELSMFDSTLIKFPNGAPNRYLTVTPLPAGHCPGSVMFLFETEKNILYTGDYRVKASDLKKYKAFFDSLGQIKTIHKLYLDTTFFNSSYLRFPSRSEGLHDICKIIKDWIQKSKKHVIKIISSANYGSEYLFMEIAKTLNMPIHVSSKLYNTYKYIPEMDNAVTLNSKETQIHSGCGGYRRAICHKQDYFVRSVVPSVLWWKDYNFTEGENIVVDNGNYRVCYSCHASLEEIREFLTFLKPLEIEPCVVPDNTEEKEKMINLLDNIKSSYQKETLKEEVKLLNADDSKTATGFNNSSTKDHTPVKEQAIELLGNLLDSPPNDFKRRRLWLNEQNSDGF